MLRLPLMHGVSSSNISSVGYENGNLYVEFCRRGSTYVYYNVPEPIYRQLITGDHPGEYLDEYVKKAGYHYERLY